jgi:catechol 2,3-dioxygenase-like lactoylglutathione lyase family enzyme
MLPLATVNGLARRTRLITIQRRFVSIKGSFERPSSVSSFPPRVHVKGGFSVDWKLELVVIPVTDVDRAKRFYSEQVGFVVDHDTRIGDDVRVVQLTPVGSACSIAIGNGLPASTPGSVQGIQLVVPDIDAAREQLLQRGVEVSAVQHFEGAVRVDGRGGDWNSFIFFSDPDGNGWVVQERPVNT